MSIYGKNFIYDGKNSSDYGVILCTFDTVKTTKDTAITYKINRSDLTPYKSVVNTYSRSYEDVLKFDIGLCKCNGKKFTLAEREEIVSWITSPIYPTLFTVTDHIIDDPYHDDIEYYCNAVSYSEFSPLPSVYGLLFSMECNAPYGFTPERKTSFSENSTFTVFNSSDEKYQNYYPIIEITASSTGKVTLVNNKFPDDIMELNMLKDQKLIIDNKYGKITDESNQFDFTKDTNLIWLKLEPGLNKITVTGNVKGVVKCRYIRKVGI